MIISASYKTDIPAFYGAWFMNRLKAGHCRTVNPYGGQVYTVDLTPGAVQGFVFWTRNAGPFLEALHEVRAQGTPFVVQFTVTGYPRALESGTVAIEAAVECLRVLARTFGRRAVVWRYDPVVVSALTPTAWHRETFARLCAALRGCVDEVVVSFVHVYAKTARNMAAAARRDGFDWRDPDDDEKREALRTFSALAADQRMALSLCGQPHLLVDGVSESRCIDAERLADVGGRPLEAPARAHRKTCRCYASRDIGEYDTCPHGCVYCYAVDSRKRAKARFQAHDPKGAFLFPPPTHQAERPSRPAPAPPKTVS